MTQPGFIPKFGGYEQLLSYQKARVVYKGTVHFIKRWVPSLSRTTDQIEQAARSGKQNIVEGSLASAVSKESAAFRDVLRPVQNPVAADLVVLPAACAGNG